MSFDKKNVGEFFSEISSEKLEIKKTIDLDSMDFEFLNTAPQTDMRGDFQFEKEKLEEISENFNNEILGNEVPITKNHNEDLEAFAWVVPKSMFVSESKNMDGEYALFGKIHRLTNDGIKSISEGVYRYFSIEIIWKFERFIEGKKKNFQNVIRAITLTNTPAVKGMAPTFSSKNNFSVFNSKMNLEDLLGVFSIKNILTKDEQENFSALISKFSEKEQDENKEAILEIQKKPEPENKKKEKEKNHTSKNEVAIFELQFPEQFSEMQNFKELVAKQGAELWNKSFAETFQQKFQLSNERNLGFLEKSKEEVRDFCSKLNDDQMDGFIKLFSQIKTIDINEYGSSSSNPKPIENLDLEIKAKERMKESGRTYAECFSEVARENYSV